MVKINCKIMTILKSFSASEYDVLPKLQLGINDAATKVEGQNANMFGADISIIPNYLNFGMLVLILNSNTEPMFLHLPQLLAGKKNF